MSDTQSNLIFDSETVRGFFSEIDEIDEDNLSLHGSYMASRGANNARKAEVIERVKAFGIPTKGFKLELKRRHAERKLELLTEDADPDVLETADQLRASLGAFADTELGGAALSQAEAEEAARERRRTAARRKRGEDAAAP